MLQLTTKMEINIQDANPAEAASASTFIVKNRIPAIIVSPESFMVAVSEKQIKRAQYKLIVAVDLENKGKNFGLDKIRDLPNEVLTADGFDILLTPMATNKETGNEMKALAEFLTKANNLTEIRWVIGSRVWDKDSINNVIEHAKAHPASFIRTDPNLDGSATPEDHFNDIERIKKEIATPIKVSGNINRDIMETLHGKAKRFDVTMTQARSIIAPRVEKEPSNQQEFEFPPLK